jgi:glycerate dehydrogenase
MNLVVLDGLALNPGDLSWDELRSLADCEIHDRTPPPQILERAVRADLVLTNKTELKREVIGKLPALKYIGVLATGTNMVDLAAARERGIPVTNVPAYGTCSVAQTTIALLLELTQQVGHHSRSVHEGRWTHAPDWCYWDFPLIELAGMTMGIVGPGRIGQMVGEVAVALGMKVLAYRPERKAVPAFAQPVDLESIFRQSDVLTLHCPLTPENKNLVNAQRLTWMKPSAYLLNTSRGGLIDEQALAAALNSGRIAGAGLDVLTIEPPPASNPLLTARNCIITPHLAWGTQAARARLLRMATQNVRAFLAGKPQNVVN